MGLKGKACVKGLLSFFARTRSPKKILRHAWAWA